MIKPIPHLWENRHRNLTLESIFRRQIPHIETISIIEMKDYYEAHVSMKWYSLLTFGILKNRTEGKIFEVWYQLHVMPSILNIIFI